MSITKQRVQQTAAYAGLDNVQQALILQKNKFELIKNGYDVTHHKGLEYWTKSFFPEPKILSIVKEMHWRSNQVKPLLGQSILFQVVRVYNINNKPKEKIIEVAGHYTGAGYMGENTVFADQQIINWQPY